MKTDKYRLHRMIGEFLDVYLAHRQLSPNTRKAYKKGLNKFRHYLRDIKRIPFEKLSFEDFNRKNVADFVTYCHDNHGTKPATVNQTLSALKAFLHYCGENDIALEQYYLDVKAVRKVKQPKEVIVKHLSEEQLKTLLSLPDQKTRVGRRDLFIIILLFEAGLRIQELLDLSVGDILEVGNSFKVKVTGKGGKTRYVPLLGPVMGYVRSYIGEFHSEGDANRPLVYTVHNCRPTKMGQGAVWYRLNKYSKKAHETDFTFPERIHAHMLRHSMGMSMNKKGIPISYIRDFLGHVSVDTTSIYAHADCEDLRVALESLENDIGEVGNETPKQKKLWKDREEYLLRLSGLA